MVSRDVTAAKLGDLALRAVDVGLVYAAATQGVADLDAFAREVAAWLSQQP